MNMSITNIQPGELAKLPKEQRLRALRGGVEEFVGSTFFAPMLEWARTGMGRNKIFHGGRGEEMFGAMLDAELARRAGRGMGSNLSQALYESWSRRV